MSNTKLTREQKAERKAILAANPMFQVLSYPEFGVTIAYVEEFPGSKMILVSASIADPSEKKFRHKVGEYFALRRLERLEGMILPRNVDFYDLAGTISAC